MIMTKKDLTLFINQKVVEGWGSQAKLAKFLGINRSSVNRTCKGDEVSPTVIKAIEKRFNVKISQERKWNISTV